ncbi:hypothetical protein DPSP01_008141 [Paraphaeosphaeria sporulosa]
MMEDYMQMKAKRDNATFNDSFMMNEVKQMLYITTTSYERRRANSLFETWKQRRNLLLQREIISLIGSGSTAMYVLSSYAEASSVRAAGAAAATGVGLAAIMLSGIGDGFRTSL